MEFKSEVELNQITPVRERQGAGSSQGPLAFKLRIKQNLMISKVAGCFSSIESHKRVLGSQYNEEGALISQDIQKIYMGVEGRACEVLIDFGLGEPMEFSDCLFDDIILKPEEGKIVALQARVVVHPTDEQIIRLARFLKEKITITINGDTVSVEEEFEEEEGEDEPLTKAEVKAQKKLDLPMDNEGHGVVTEDAKPADAKPAGDTLDQQNAQDAQHGAVTPPTSNVVPITPAKKVPPSTAHGEVQVEGMPPPQRPRRAPPAGGTKH